MTKAELFKLLASVDDDEPITFYLFEKTPLYGEQKMEIIIDGISSTAGGRASLVWMKKRDLERHKFCRDGKWTDSW